jgi:glycosyltransferase involved in cell wall biosynthesis
LRALFLSVHRPGRSPSQRFRFEQYLDWLRAQGVECDHSWVLDAEDDRHFYGRGAWHRKAWVGMKALARRAGLALSPGLTRYDVALVQREALFTGPPFVEAAVRRAGAGLVFDYDDSLWLGHVSEANRSLAWLKWAGKTDALIAQADLVLAGNAYLADHARTRGARVEVVPTTIDTDLYQPPPPRPPGPVCIGWSGSFSTLAHFQALVPVLRRVKARLGGAVRFTVLGDAGYREPALDLQGEAWRLETEIQDLSRIDIGLMPLPDDAWARGKCGLKGLQYMALGIPTLMSPVGVNVEIIRDGESGFLPRNDDEWVDRLCALATDAALRRRLGGAGREVVVSRYSVRAWRERYLALLASAARR